MSEFVAKQAKRERVTLKAAFQGPSGSGKTLSALFFAKGVVKGDMSKVFVIDTENRSALMYADREGLEGWKHIDFKPPFTPERYIAAITSAESQGAQCILIDSISHEWEGKGGILGIHTDVVRGQKGGNSYTAWEKVTPRHNAFVDKLLQSPANIIATIRAKTEYALVKNDKDKLEPKKIGLKGIQREGLDYEFSVIFEVALSHFSEATKDRTGLFMPLGPFMVTEQAGEMFVDWSASGVLREEEPEQPQPPSTSPPQPSNSTLPPNADYVIQFGKGQGRTIADIELDTHLAWVKWFKDEERRTGVPTAFEPHKEYLQKVEPYIKQLRPNADVPF
jgi:hypothetical protein